jgi:NTP pyrophosphatase (non-canonical NTP hydrolase)
MSDYLPLFLQLRDDVTAMSAAVSGSYPASMQDELVDRRRLDKLATEVGEVLDAYNDYVGENPRKGVCGTLDHVLEELLDVAACALAAYEHLTLSDSRTPEDTCRSVNAIYVQALRERASEWLSSDLMDVAAWLEGTL